MVVFCQLIVSLSVLHSVDGLQLRLGSSYLKEKSESAQGHRFILCHFITV